MINLRLLRENRNMTQEQLANMLGVSRSTYTRYEQGTRECSYEMLLKISNIFNVTIDHLLNKQTLQNKPKGIKIPVLGKVIAGVPIEAVTDIMDWEEIPQEMAATGEFFALQIKGDSMTPRIQEGDVVIVKKQPSVESGEIAIILVNGDEATIKQVYIQENGIMLQAFNPAVYPAHFYSNQEILKLPVSIIGKVVELRGKF
jgi:repressor LexA